jgi:hypothetical protein
MPRKEGDTRYVPRRLLDTWYYKVKDVQFDDRECIPPKDRDDDGRFPATGEDYSDAGQFIWGDAVFAGSSGR